MADAKKTLRITQVKSSVGRKADQGQTLRALGLGNVSPLLIQISHLLFILSYMRKLRFSYFLTVFMPFEAFSSILESNANVLAFFSFAPANASSISLFVSCLKLMPIGSNK